MAKAYLLILTILLFVTAAPGQDFKPDCEFPLHLKDLKQKQDIDSECQSIEGKGSDASKAQNSAKNNFCAKPPMMLVTVLELKSLQAATRKRLKALGIPFGSPSSIPANRDALQQNFKLPNGKRLAEGKLVSIVAYVLDARHSNVKTGEKVNCDAKGRKNNDIHIELGARRDTDPCNSITAEISPHFRPDVWDEFDDFTFTNPVRIIGQLFFDASHLPCERVGMANEKRRHPSRISSWEIHPVYAISVCKNSTISACSPEVESKWVSFDEWVNLPDDKDVEEP